MTLTKFIQGAVFVFFLLMVILTGLAIFTHAEDINTHDFVFMLILFIGGTFIYSFILYAYIREKRYYWKAKKKARKNNIDNYSNNLL